MYITRIITDSGCDIPAKAKLKHVDILGFYITTEDGKSYEERYEISNKEYYKILENCTNIPKTAHITIATNAAHNAVSAAVVLVTKSTIL